MANTNKEAIGSDSSAVLAHILSWKHTDALRVASPILRKLMREASVLSAEARSLLRAVKYIRAHDLLDSSSRQTFLCQMLWYGAHEAAGQCVYIYI
jgi:hypothetical protein